MSFFVHMTCGGCQPRERQRCRRKQPVDYRKKERKEPLGRCGVKTVQGGRQPPGLHTTETPWPRQRRNSVPPIRRRGGSYDTRKPWHSATACSRVQRLCRQSPSEQRFRDRVYPHTASVLTWLKLEKRQTSAVKLPFAQKSFRSRRSRVYHGPAPWKFLKRHGGNRQTCQGVDCAHLNAL